MSFYQGRQEAIYQFVENFKPRFPDLPNIAFDFAVSRGFPNVVEKLLDQYAIKMDPAAIAFAIYKRHEGVLRFSFPMVF